jgi:hypothetical protein
MEDKMKRFTLAIIFVLLGLNLLGTLYLIVSRYFPNTEAAFHKKISEAELTQILKIMNLVVEFRSELESVAANATYPSEKIKIEAREYLQSQRMIFEQARIEHKMLHKEKTQQAAIRFLFTCWGQDNILAGPRLMEVDKTRFGKYDQGLDGINPYPNVSFTKLESINNEFRILALSIIKDFK